MDIAPYKHLKHVEQLARVTQHIDPDNNDGPIVPTRWGPASWWRIGLLVFAILIALTLVYRFIG